VYFISITWTKKNTKLISISQDKLRQKLANSDVTKEALNCTASLYMLTALLTPLISSAFSVTRKPILPISGCGWI